MRTQGPETNRKSRSSTASAQTTDKALLTERIRPDFERGFETKLSIVDLFAGCGGMTLGIAEACRQAGVGLDVALAMEIDPLVRAVYDTNFRVRMPGPRADVRDRFQLRTGARLSKEEKQTRKEAGNVDLLVGGPPCQGHSNLNNHTRQNDPKNQLYMVMVRAAEVLEPGHVIIENVPGVQRDSSKVLDRAAKALKRLGYRVAADVINVADLGVPQLRTRHVLVGSRSHQPSLKSMLERHAKLGTRNLRWAIGDLENISSKSLFDTAAVLSPENERRAHYLLDEGLYDLPNRLRPPCHRNKPDHRYISMYGRLRWDHPARTITRGFGSPGQGRFLHPSQPRTLTPHEAARLQFFPDWFDFSAANHRSALAHCIGNAVPSRLAHALTLETVFRNRIADPEAQRSLAFAS